MSFKLLAERCITLLRQKYKPIGSDLMLLGDFSQLNRRTIRAWRRGRQSLAFHQLVDHQRRRLKRRREIRELVGH